MFQTIATNANNDLYLDSNGNIAMASGIKAVGNVVRNKVDTLLRELLYNTDLGIPYFQTVFDDSSKIPLFLNEVKQVILTVDHVQSVTGISYNFDAKKGILTYLTVIITDYGNLNFTNTVNLNNV